MLDKKIRRIITCCEFALTEDSTSNRFYDRDIILDKTVDWIIRIINGEI